MNIYAPLNGEIGEKRRIVEIPAEEPLTVPAEPVVVPVEEPVPA
jgi:hypothetical protein